MASVEATRGKAGRRRFRSASVGHVDELGRQLEYSELQPLMVDEQHRTMKAAKVVSVLRSVLGENGLEGRFAIDIGCSAGFLADALASAGARTVGLDIDVPGLRRAEDRFGDKVDFLCASGQELPFADGSVDIVVFNHIYEHVPDPDAAFREIHRVLAPHGVAYLALGNKYQIIEPHYRLPLLSWLPRSVADRYMRVSRRGDSYFEHFSSRKGLRRLARGFRILDYTVPVIHRPDLYRSGDQVPTRFPVPAGVARALLPIVPTFIWIATKDERRPVDRVADIQVVDLRDRSDLVG